MKNITLFLLIIFCGCIPNKEIADSFDISAMEGFCAYSISFHSKGKNTKDDVCTCNGTGYITSGDGILKIKCPCGDHCKCLKVEEKKVDVDKPKTPEIEKPKPKPKDLLVLPPKFIKWYTANEGCVPCKKQEQIFKQTKWIIVNEYDGTPFHILKVSYPKLDNVPSGMAVPTFELIVNEKPIRTKIGVMEHEELLKFWDNKDE